MRSVLKREARKLRFIGPAVAKIAGPRDPGDIGFGGLDGGGGGRDDSGNAGAHIEADAEASIPLIIEEVKHLLTADRKMRIQERTGSTPGRTTRLVSLPSRRPPIEASRMEWHSDQHSPGLCRTLAANHERRLVPCISQWILRGPSRATLGSQ